MNEMKKTTQGNFKVNFSGNAMLNQVLGIYEGLILTRIDYWIQFNKSKNKYYFEGHQWSGFLSGKELGKQLGIPDKTISKYLNELTKANVLVTGNFNQRKYDKTKWYRIDYKNLKIYIDSRIDEISVPVEEIYASIFKDPTSLLGKPIASEETPNSPTERISSPIEPSASLLEDAESPMENANTPIENTIPVTTPVNKNDNKDDSINENRNVNTTVNTNVNTGPKETLTQEEIETLKTLNCLKSSTKYYYSSLKEKFKYSELDIENLLTISEQSLSTLDKESEEYPAVNNYISDMEKKRQIEILIENWGPVINEHLYN